MNKKIIITPDKDVKHNLLFVSAMLLIWNVTCSLYLYFSIDRSRFDHVGVLLIIACEIIIIMLFTLLWMQFYKTFILDNEGMTVKFWKYQKNYSWADFKVKKLENSKDCIFARYAEGVIFSTKPIKSSTFFATHELYTLKHFLLPLASPFFIDFKEKSIAVTSYKVEKEAFLADLSSLGVELE